MIRTRFQLLQAGDPDLVFSMIIQNQIGICILCSILIHRLRNRFRTNPDCYIIPICTSRFCINRRCPHQQNASQKTGKNSFFHVTRSFSSVPLITTFRLSCFRASAYIKQYVKKTGYVSIPGSLKNRFSVVTISSSYASSIALPIS